MFGLACYPGLEMSVVGCPECTVYPVADFCPATGVVLFARASRLDIFSRLPGYRIRSGFPATLSQAVALVCAINCAPGCRIVPGYPVRAKFPATRLLAKGGDGGR